MTEYRILEFVGSDGKTRFQPQKKITWFWIWDSWMGFDGHPRIGIAPRCFFQKEHAASFLQNRLRHEISTDTYHEWPAK